MRAMLPRLRHGEDRTGSQSPSESVRAAAWLPTQPGRQDHDFLVIAWAHHRRVASSRLAHRVPGHDSHRLAGGA